MEKLIAKLDYCDEIASNPKLTKCKQKDVSIDTILISNPPPLINDIALKKNEPVVDPKESSNKEAKKKADHSIQSGNVFAYYIKGYSQPHL